MRDGTNKLLWLAAGAGACLLLRQAIRSMRKMDLEGRTALIAGGSRGLGLVLARGLAARGMRLVLCARDHDELERAWEELHEQTEVLTIPCDLRHKERIHEMVQTALARFGAIDVLVNNAGVISVAPMEEMTQDDYEEAMQVHYWAPLHAIGAVLPSMRQRRQGRIVNISSIGGKVSVPHLLPYCGSKFALTGLSEGLRSELCKDGILVTTVIPGLMRTGSPRNAFFKGQHEREYAWFSISDSLPGLSMSAEAAAERIISAMQFGEAEVVLTLPAWLAVRFHGVFPGLTADILGLVNRLLPGPGGIGKQRAPGKESESWAAPSVLTTLTEHAARRNNEVAPEEGRSGANV
jgi:short-subunit dehydrogenase